MKFRIGRLVYLDFSHDETVMGFAFPKDWREVLVGSVAWATCVPKKVVAAYQATTGN